MRERRFVQTDVFSTVPGRGNGLAVVAESEGLSQEDMQRFAAWTNLAETTFLLPPTDERADYRVKIFTPAHEMPFAGHPTLGSCAAWLHLGGVPRNPNRVVQECNIGLVDVDLSGDPPAFVAPDTRFAAMPDDMVDDLCAALKVDRSRVVRSALLENGPSWKLLEFASAEDVLGIDSSLVSWPTYQGVSVLGPHVDGHECDFEVRNLSPSSGMSEDPITGSLNAAIARWMHADGRVQGELVIAQGTRIDRLGRVFVRVSETDPDQVLIGGHSQIVIDGTLHF